MRVETLLPLGKLDPGLREPDTPLHIGAFAAGAQQAEEIGFDAVLVEETKDDPYQLLALGAAATTTLGLGTSVAMAFPRSPTITAMSAWSLQKLSGGRFSLGLGSQVRGHVQVRLGMGGGHRLRGLHAAVVHRGAMTLAGQIAGQVAAHDPGTDHRDVAVAHPSLSRSVITIRPGRPTTRAR